MYKFLFKPIIDFLLCTIALLILSQVLVLIILFLMCVNSGNPFFIQRRPGKHGKIFKVIKFKTMNNHRDAEGNLLPDSERLTLLGKFLRKLSLDEIPQILNVIKGDMSLVGPRPLLPEYLPLYSKEQARRHEVRPGITGWAQVNGRNAISWEDKFKFDVWYVDNISFILDVKIVFLTIAKVFKSEGINQNGQATMEPFNGNN